jgi:hypothetical protein
MENTDNIANKKTNRPVIQHCECCNFSAHTHTEWAKHIETKKHQRNGAKILTSLKCDTCNFITVNSYNLNIHKIIVHGTPEERKAKSKFYCENCDKGFFAKLFYDLHMASKKHSNMIEYNKLINQDKESDSVSSELLILDQSDNINILNELEHNEQILNV